ncbi:hypothetical protein DE146DRAFT_616680 [Phaeosphaeria sp. MPI-PUGE-AT-0046c]|nr:hypothetical protein DE146DRAFT_616680 [Phaeosphaeria sp. MPI-PUGE-AT-0046c]
MLTHKDSNGQPNGRDSRASNLSTLSRVTNMPIADAGGQDKHDGLPVNSRAVMSMLRTSTDMGNLGGPLGDGLGQGPTRSLQRRGGASSRLSTASSMSNHSNYTNRPQHRQRPSTSSAPRNSTREPMPYGPHYNPDTLQPTTAPMAESLPLVPMLRRGHRDSQRSMSMTNTRPHPEARLSNNRSMTSLRNDEFPQRFPSPYAYSSRFHRLGHRAASPAWNDAPGSGTRRLQTHNNQVQDQYSGQMRRRVPSDPSLGRSDMAEMPRRPSDTSLGHPERLPRMSRRSGRGPSPAHHQTHDEEIPPMPDLTQHYHPAVEQARKLNKSAKGSVSSGSTNMRTDSEAPSSDLPLPPTPRDCASMDAFAGPLSSQAKQANTSPDYYDGSEYWYDNQTSRRSPAKPMPTGLVGPTRNVAKELGYNMAHAPVKKRPSLVDSDGTESDELPGMPELPASPVGRRVTRESIRQQLDPSTTSDYASSSKDPMKEPETGRDHRDQNEHNSVTENHGTGGSSMLPSGAKSDFNNSLSQTVSSLLYSSTIEFAVKCTIPAMTNADSVAIKDNDTSMASASASAASPEKNTDDGMSDVLAGYQHTDSKQDGSFVPSSGAVRKTSPAADPGSERVIQHTPKSSDEQSFKSCTDVPDGVPPGEMCVKVAKSLGPAGRARLGAQHSSKDPDVRSFQNEEGNTSSNRIDSMPPSRLPSSILETDVQPKTPMSDPPSSSPALPLHKSIFERHMPSFSITSKLKSSSKRSLKQASLSVSGSSSTLNNSQLPPSVPARESSASSEAQRHRAISSFLVNSFSKTPRFSKGKKASNIEENGVKTIIDSPTSRLAQQGQSLVDSSLPAEASNSNIKTSERALTVEHTVRDSRITSNHVEYSPRLPLPSVQEDTTTDLRLSMFRYHPAPRNLPDLKEESHEDSSLNTSAGNLKNSHFRFPYGSGAGMRPSVDDGMLLPGKLSMGSRRGSGIVEAQGLPSLEFSEANLLEKLKDVFGDIRLSRSSGRTQLGVVDIEEGPFRLSVMADEDGQVAVGPLTRTDDAGAYKTSARSTTMFDFAKLKRNYSPERLIAEIDGMSIPSITQLTQRVTQMLPSLSLAGQRGLVETDALSEFREGEEILEYAIKEIHHVHAPSQKRSSARLRPIPGSSALVIVDDDVYEEITGKERGGASPDDQCVRDLEFDVEVGEEAGSRATAKGKGRAITPTPPLHLSIATELRTPPPAVLRPEAPSKSDRALRTSVESALSSTRSPRSFVSTHTAIDTRPWNYDKNYPWATTIAPSVDISLPPPTTLRDSPRPGPSHLRNTLSDATSSTFTSTHARIASPTNNSRQQHRLSIFGRSGDQAHAVGERYPTSALSPPTAIFRDNFSTSGDTSDDEDFLTSRKANKLTLRKRFSSAARTNTHTTPRAARSKVNPAELASPASAHETSYSTLQYHTGEPQAFFSNRHTFRDAEGMRIGAYHRQKIVESIKRWWHKGGELFRNLSRRHSGRREDVDNSGRD